MPKNGIWMGCGHKIRPMLYCDKPCCTVVAITNQLDFQDDNPDDLCFDCWKNNQIVNQ